MYEHRTSVQFGEHALRANLLGCLPGVKHARDPVAGEDIRTDLPDEVVSCEKSQNVGFQHNVSTEHSPNIEGLTKPPRLERLRHRTSGYSKFVDLASELVDMQSLCTGGTQYLGSMASLEKLYSWRNVAL